MTWGGYGTFVSFAAAIVLAPGPDVAVVRKNSLRGGRRDGLLSSLGVVASGFAQGTAAALGLRLSPFPHDSADLWSACNAVWSVWLPVWSALIPVEIGGE